MLMQIIRSFLLMKHILSVESCLYETSGVYHSLYSPIRGVFFTLIISTTSLELRDLHMQKLLCCQSDNEVSHFRFQMQMIYRFTDMQTKIMFQFHLDLHSLTHSLSNIHTAAIFRWTTGEYLTNKHCKMIQLWRGEYFSDRLITWVFPIHSFYIHC